jgi:hypothetical protein
MTASTPLGGAEGENGLRKGQVVEISDDDSESDGDGAIASWIVSSNQTDDAI